MKFTQILLLATIVCLASVYATDSCDVPNPAKLDCGFSGMNPADCTGKGCCWVPATQAEEISFRRMLRGEIKSEQTPNNTPWCFYKGDSNVCKNHNFVSATAGFEGTYAKLYENFMKNINIQNKGGVVASPDPNTPGGSYIYHWMRDAGLTMRAFMKINDYELSKVQFNMEKYLGWVTHVQHENDPNNISVLIEPKFDLPDGQPYVGGWCRPQTDGPGLRSGALIQYANILLDAGQQVNAALYSASGSGAINIDLNWIVGGWRDEGCDLWEEIRSKDFFWNRMSFYQSLTWGAKLAKRLGDTASEQKWTSVAQEIKPTIYAHWNGTYVFESTNREKDSAVIHAFIELNEGLFEMTGKEVAGTIQTLNQLFCLEYTINQTQDEQGVPGILYGRYQGDSYAGGNPWQLLTAALAEAFYQGAEAMLVRGEEILAEEEVAHWRSVYTELSEKPSAMEFAAAAYSAGNSVMFRMWQHVQSDVYQLAEQMSRETGAQLSAKSLTWSFANVLKNLHSYSNNSKFNVLKNYKKE